jgi:acylglycerol lipase
MMAEEDVVVDNSKVKDLMEESASEDKTLKSYAALHGLLCEPAPLLGIIEDDLIQWLVQRCP